MAKCLLCEKRETVSGNGEYMGCRYMTGVSFDFCNTCIRIPKILRDIKLERKLAYSKKKVIVCRTGPQITFENFPSTPEYKIPRGYRE